MRYRRFVKPIGNGFEFYEVFFREDQETEIQAIQDYGYTEAGGPTIVAPRPELELFGPPL